MDDVASAVNEALELIDAKQLMSDGMTILLKPNLLSAKPPERAVTTHPEVLRAVIRWVKKFNPKRVVVSDSSAGVGRNTTRKVFNASLLQQTAEEEGVEAIPFESMERTVYGVENPMVLNDFPSAKIIEEADLIINLPKIKTHGLTKLTCSIKNMFGTVILGNKPKTHAQYSKMEDFSKALADIYSVSKPQLTIIDGYLCQEGNGPSAGDVVKMDLILAGYDGVALDATVCSIIGLDVNEVLHVKYVEKKGIGTTNLKSVEYKGVGVNDVMREFRLPSGSNRATPVPIPTFLRGVVDKVFKADVNFDLEKCTLCGTCWTNCPVEAISKPEIMEKESNIPIWNKKKCITCYCCAETCPYEAIEFKINPKKNLIFSELGVLLIVALVVLALLIWWLVTLF